MKLLGALFGVLLPTVTLAATLDVPSPGDRLSGLGVIHGWKCNPQQITVSIDGSDPIPALAPYPRADTGGACGNAGWNGFFTIVNWGIFGDGSHTITAADNGVPFATHTFTVTTLGEEFVTGVEKRATIEDFPAPGESVELEWNQSTQHFEITELLPAATDAVGSAIASVFQGIGTCTTAFRPTSAAPSGWICDGHIDAIKESSCGWRCDPDQLNCIYDAEMQSGQPWCEATQSTFEEMHPENVESCLKALEIVHESSFLESTRHCAPSLPEGIDLFDPSDPYNEEGRHRDGDDLLEETEATCGRPYRGSRDPQEHYRFHCIYAYYLECHNLTEQHEQLCRQIRAIESRNGGQPCPHC